MGRYCSVADKVEILLGGNHRLGLGDDLSVHGAAGTLAERRDLEGSHASNGDVTIGDDVWLGSGCLILSGVTIGPGAVIGAHAVVSRDVPPYAIVAGNPARVIRIRFSEES